MLMSRDQTIERNKEKQDLILRFLRTETYTTNHIIKRVLGIATVQGANKTLLKLEAKNLVKKHAYNYLGNSVNLWGITPHGVAMSFSDDEDYKDYKHFEPNRISLAMIPHTIGVQTVRLDLQGQGYRDFINCDKNTHLSEKYRHRPDLIATNSLGECIAIEVERTIKSKKRYMQLMFEHLALMKAKKWRYVHYYSPNSTIQKALNRIFNSIEYVLCNSERIDIEDKHRERFKFFVYEE